jgi:hypothetical protein
VVGPPQVVLKKSTDPSTDGPDSLLLGRWS